MACGVECFEWSVRLEKTSINASPAYVQDVFPYQLVWCKAGSSPLYLT